MELTLKAAQFQENQLAITMRGFEQIVWKLNYSFSAKSEILWEFEILPDGINIWKKINHMKEYKMLSAQ